MSKENLINIERENGKLTQKGTMFTKIQERSVYIEALGELEVLKQRILNEIPKARAPEEAGGPPV